MENKKKYSCMPRPSLMLGPFSIEPVQICHTENIREWRNSQMDVLRQSSIITPADQDAYYKNNIWSELNLENPRNILVAYSENSHHIGYGGLVHIAWQHRRAEVSFLMNPVLTHDTSMYERYFKNFLSLVKILAFDDLGIERLFTETYANRVAHIKVLENSGFNREGVLRNHVRIDGRPVDSVMHGCLLPRKIGEVYEE